MHAVLGRILNERKQSQALNDAMRNELNKAKNMLASLTVAGSSTCAPFTSMYA